MTTYWQGMTRRERWASGLFWSWNLIFLAFMTLGFAPRILPDMILAVGTAAIPASFLLYALVLAAVPVAAIALGLTKLRRAPLRLFALGYVVEGPLMLTLAVRFFIIREATPGITALLAVASLGMGAFLWHVLDPEVERRGSFSGGLRLAGLTLMALTSLYAAVWIAFYALPIGYLGLDFIARTLTHLGEFFRDLWSMIRDLFAGGLIWLPFSLLGTLLGIYTATLVVLTPIAVPVLSLRAWWRTLRSLAGRIGWTRSVGVTALTLAACALVFVYANRQPQGRAFALLEAPPDSAQEARALLDRQDIIRDGLLNAYLAPFRYISAMGEVVHVRTIYRQVFGMTQEDAAGVQRLYERVARPMLYTPVHPLKSLDQDGVALRREPEQAAELYRRFFDQPIVQGERDTIVQAVRSTWSWEQAEAAWLAVDDREVYLLRQEVRVEEHGDWAEVELMEVYQNQTSQLQEVVYYFNLPESAVLTGVWLGESEVRADRYAFQVAPRGAAQAVYREETRQNRDPALLEQIGPRQYRLRIYPIPPIRLRPDGNGSHTMVDAAPPLYMWITYQVMASEGGWPLPQLALHRNVYWDGDTGRTTNGDPMRVRGEDWLPAAVAAVGPTDPHSHRVDLPGGWTVTAVPVAPQDAPALPGGLRLAVVLDRSRSMAVHADRMAASLATLREVAGARAVIDAYLTASPYRGEPPTRAPLDTLEPGELLFFGGQNAAELLAQFESLRGGDRYDAVLVLTDGSGYELGESPVDVAIPEAPVWMIHLGGDLPLGYDDDTLEAIQASGGGVVGALEQALTRMAVTLTGAGTPAGGLDRDRVDGYEWTVLPTAQASGGSAADPAFVPFAARRLILAHMRRWRGEIASLDTLDSLHAIARAHGIVTPYSSMIVLVEFPQEQLLERLSALNDRFDREVEDLADTTPGSPVPLAGVPEPHEWLLIGLAVAMLLWYAGRERLVWQRR